MWINGENTAGTQYIVYDKSGSNWGLGLTGFYPSNGNTFGTTIGNYSNFSDLFDASQRLVNILGFPWIAVGAKSKIGTSTLGVLGFNLDALGGLPADSGTGLGFGSYTSPGYDPWPDGTTALAAILSLIGNLSVI